jgi:AcrR family transcriptional regulator
MPPAAQQVSEPQKLSRVERKQQQARSRIISAATALLAERPIDDITIADITSTADVGHGSFYLHFKSKHDVLTPIVAEYASAMDERFQRLTASLTDPAAIIALSARLTAREVKTNPIWRWYLVHSAAPLEEMSMAFRSFSLRDIENGIQAGRFEISNIKLTTNFGFGGFINAVKQCIDEEDADEKVNTAIELMLRVFGVPAEDAHELAHQPLTAEDTQ